MPEGQDATAPPAPPGEETAPAGDLGITVALDQFSGPMDLLLYLVRRAEVDIKDLPVTTIADQFAAWVSAAAGTTIDLEAAGDFVVMAATLLEIKARMVAPPPEGTEVADDGEDEFDPRAGLIRKLLVYRAAKEAAFDLDRREDQRRLRHHRGHREVVPDDAAEVDAWELKDVGAGTLANLWFDLLKRIDGLGPRTVLVDDMPMGVRMAQVVEDMRQRGEGRLSELFAIDSGPVARVGIVMAVLECTRQRQLRVNQAEQYGDVLIRFRAEDDRAITVGDPGPPEQLPKRQRRPPLVTWSGTPGQNESEDGDALEEPPENEEQRFLRELESTVGVERLLSRAADLEKGFIGWWEETHPGEPLPPGVVKPEPPPPPPPPPVVEAKPEAPPKPKRQPKPAVAAPAVEAPAAAVVQAQPEAVPAQPSVPDPRPAEPQAAPQPVPVTAVVVPDVPTAVAPSAPDPVAAVPVPAPDPQPASPAAPSFEVVPLAVAPEPPPAQIPAAPPDPEASLGPTSSSSSDVDAESPAALPGPRASARDDVAAVPSPVVPLAVAPESPPAQMPLGPTSSSSSAVDAAEPVPAPVESPAALPGPQASARDDVAAVPVDQPASPVEAIPPSPVEPPAALPEPEAVVPHAADELAPAVEVAPARAAAPAEPPPDPDPPPPPATTANTPPTPATTPNHPSKPTPMSRPRHLKLAALAALWVLSIVGFVAWLQRPGAVLSASGPQDAVVARDGELAWTLNLALDPEAREDWLLPSASQPGTFAWRDERTCVFTPAGALPAGAELVVTFAPKLRALGGFRFDEQAVPSFRVRTLPALSVAEPRAALPAFGDGSIELALSRVPADPAPLLAAVAVSPAVPLTKSVVDGRLRLSGPFVPGTTYRLTVADTVSGKADDRPTAWQGDVAMPVRTPGARLAAGTGRQAVIEAVNLPWLVVEDASGAREVVRFAAAAGDVPARAELPAWLLRSGANRLQLRWPGGAGEIELTRHDLPLTPDDAAPALLGGSLPVVSAH